MEKRSKSGSGCSAQGKNVAGVRTVSALVALLCLTGCGSSRETGLVAKDDLRKEGNRALATQWDASNRQIRVCMKREGFDDPEPPKDSAPILVTGFPPTSERDLLTTEKFGYGLAASLDLSRRREGAKVAALLKMNEPTRREHFLAEQKCKKNLENRSKNKEGAILAVVGDAYFRYNSDRDVKGIEQRWSNCMKSQGWTVEVRGDLYTLASKKLEELEERDKVQSELLTSVELAQELLGFERTVAKSDSLCSRPMLSEIAEKWQRHKKEALENR